MATATARRPAVKPKRKRAGPPPAWLMRHDSDVAAVERGCWYDAPAGERAAEFIETFCRQSKGRWGGELLQLMDWQKRRIVLPLFGWKRPDGTRRFRHAWVLVPKKNGKSTLAAALGLTLLLADGEAGAEVYSVATDRDQASIVHDEAIRMVEASPDLSRRLIVNRSTKHIGDPTTNSRYAALSGESHNKEGLNAHGLIADELHVWRDRGLYDALRYAGSSRAQPLFFKITTAGVYDQTALWWELHDQAQRIEAGTLIDPDVLTCIYGAAPEEDWTDPAVWERVNPSWGVTIDPAEVRAACEEAKALPRLENAFRRYRLNQPVEQAERWLPIAAWDACKSDVDESELAAAPCWAGIDLADTDDLTALVFVWRIGERFVVRGEYFAPADSATKGAATNRNQYELWARHGYMRLTPGAVSDSRYVAERLDAARQRYDLREVAFDPWGARTFAAGLQERGYRMVEIRQGFQSLNEPSKAFEAAVRSGNLSHNGDPVLRWMVGNAATITDPAGNIKPSKAHSPGKIDGVVAAVIALARAMVGGGASERSIYDSRGIRYV